MKRVWERADKITRVATIATLCFMAAWGVISVVAEVRPFWVDEWRIIYNLKFKTSSELWGKLDFMQQFPRMYLVCIKQLVAAANYSYASLRLPGFIAALCAMLAAFRLSDKLFPKSSNKMLFVMALVSAYTFTEYFVQIKQYSMELLLCVMAIWQFVSLLEMWQRRNTRWRFVLLCLSFVVFPFFSYSYPICVAPIYLLASLYTLQRIKNKSGDRSLFILWLPLALCAASCIIFYKLDVSQVMADEGMKQWWGQWLNYQNYGIGHFLYGIFSFFAASGSGFFFWVIFGSLGIVAFLASLGQWKKLFATQEDPQSAISLYAGILIIVVMLLHFAHKMPLAEPRLVAFAIPSITILLINLLDSARGKVLVPARVVGLLMFAGLIGNIYTTVIHCFNDKEYDKKMTIYRATEQAITDAQKDNLEILITATVAYPYDTTRNLPYCTTVPGDWVLKTFPAYDVQKQVPVHPLKQMKYAHDLLQRLPAKVKTAMVGDGIHYEVIHR
jgi:hypothetical protein